MTDAPKQYRYRHKVEIINHDKANDVYTLRTEEGEKYPIVRHEFERDYEPVEDGSYSQSPGNKWTIRSEEVIDNCFMPPPLPVDDEPVEPAAQGWRPIDENTPRDGIVLLSYWHEMPCFIAWADNDGWRVLMNGRGGEFQIHGNYFPYKPTHFQYLPKPPAREE